jgi:hypothetical protein
VSALVKRRAIHLQEITQVDLFIEQPDSAVQDLAVFRLGNSRARCGIGFGKYPLGVMDAVEECVKAGASTPKILAALYDFRERLTR